MNFSRDSFCIYSLPRSGSAWLSVFLSGPASLCLHEPIVDLPQHQLLQLLEGRPERTVGIIDTAGYRVAPKLPGSFRRRFVLLRDPEEIRRSSARFGVTYDAIAEQRRLLEVLPDAERIEHHCFGDPGYLRALWGRVIGEGFDPLRAQMLREMRIERDVKSFLASRPRPRIAV